MTEPPDQCRAMRVQVGVDIDHAVDKRVDDNHVFGFLGV
jgi:hypothetical protein